MIIPWFSIFRYGAITAAISIALWLQLKTKLFGGNDAIFSAITLFLTFVIDKAFGSIEHQKHENKEAFNNEFYNRIRDNISFMKNDTFGTIATNLDMGSSNDELGNFLDTQFKELNTRISQIATTISSMEANFEKYFAITKEKTNRHLIKQLENHWRERYKNSNPTKVSDFITFIQDFMPEQFELVKTAAVDPTKTGVASGRSKFNNFKNDAIILFDNLDSILLFLSTKYKKA